MTREDKLREKNKTIRQLKAQVRQLRKELKLAQSEMELIRELWEKDVIELAKKQRRKKLADKRNHLCPQCGNDTISTSLLGIWKLIRCTACDYFNREKLDDTD
jgi:predicted RNA-binding Zn-ribbon protein involved in translation (DUF1610 family)